MEEPKDRLVAARKRSGKTHQELADMTGVNRDWYYDLESYAPELSESLSLLQLRNLCAALDVSPLWLMTGGEVSGAKKLLPSELMASVKSYLGSNNLDLTEFEDKIGYTIASVLEHPDRIFEEWNVDCLKEVCNEIGVDWVDALPVNESANARL